MYGYKLLTIRKDGTLGPLFINRKMRVPINRWLKAELYETKGFKVRKGWHVMDQPSAPHLSRRGRVWCKVEIRDFLYEDRPESQGGRWYIAQEMRVLGVIDTH